MHLCSVIDLWPREKPFVSFRLSRNPYKFCWTVYAKVVIETLFLEKFFFIFNNQQQCLLLLQKHAEQTGWCESRIKQKKKNPSTVFMILKCHIYQNTTYMYIHRISQTNFTTTARVGQSRYEFTLHVITGIVSCFKWFPVSHS